MNRIFVERGNENIYHVEVVDPDGSKSQHVVTVEAPFKKRIGWQHEAMMEELLRRSFEFLLEREPKESILPNFELETITKYYPEFEEQIRKE